MADRVFKCLRCVECCFFRSIEDCPVVYPWEKRALERIAPARGVELSFAPYLSYVDGSSGRAVVVLYRWVIEGYCPFYDRGMRGCSIYSERPFSCRMYPLILGLKDNTLRLASGCRWVRENLGEPPGPIDPSRVFPSEYRVAVENFVRLKQVTQLLSSMGLREVVGDPGMPLVDLDEYIRVR